VPELELVRGFKAFAVTEHEGAYRLVSPCRRTVWAPGWKTAYCRCLGHDDIGKPDCHRGCGIYTLASEQPMYVLYARRVAHDIRQTGAIAAVAHGWLELAGTIDPSPGEIRAHRGRPLTLTVELAGAPEHEHDRILADLAAYGATLTSA
jgi:hypothetical protein